MQDEPGRIDAGYWAKVSLLVVMEGGGDVAADVESAYDLAAFGGSDELVGHREFGQVDVLAVRQAYDRLTRQASR